MIKDNKDITMAKLAIRGHATRGREVIELLEMLGGKNAFPYDGNDIKQCYWIDEDHFIQKSLPLPFTLFTLEEFLEKYPYKVGDAVLYKSYNTTHFIRKIFWENDKILYELSDEVYSDGCSMPDTLIFTVDAVQLQPYKEEIKFDIPKGYEFAGVDDNAQQVVFTKIQPKYPKTYEECCKVLDIQSDWHLTLELNNLASCDLCVNKEFEYIYKLEAFRKLLICRDAYWKIAGEQMGLGKPWEPDWNHNTEKYVIYPFQYLYSIDKENYRNTILAFLTREMRDVFKENFDDYIEFCKEFL